MKTDEIYTLKVVENFAAAHYIRGDKAKCANQHGHNYKVEAEIEADTLNSIGMAINFLDIKKELKNIISKIDHCNLNDIEPFRTINPSAENIARWIYKELSKRLNDDVVKVVGIGVWETEKYYAHYKESN